MRDPDGRAFDWEKVGVWGAGLTLAWFAARLLFG